MLNSDKSLKFLLIINQMQFVYFGIHTVQGLISNAGSKMIRKR
nr:MAG TPA: hypothetical protein [Caudoviricetes sp.]